MRELTPAQWFWAGVLLLGFLAWLDILFVNFLYQQIRKAKWKWFCYRRRIRSVPRRKLHGD